MRIQTEDTIVAIATPAGVGGVGIVRLSGVGAISIVDQWFTPGGGVTLAKSRSHLMRHGWVQAEGIAVDEVLAVAMKAPHSYTGEDVAEVHCHGGLLAMRTVLELALKSGARLAEPGEFTMRAFFNGRIDLTQAEAVGDVIRARSELGLRVSVNQLKGRLHEAIVAQQEELAGVSALVAAGIDFPEEDVTFYHREELRERLDKVKDTLHDLLDKAGQGRRLTEGLAVAIVGRPNVGKSSLLNALLRENRAIVTEVPGTTRDTLEELAEIKGLALRLIDTAGIRETEDVVEREGISRSRKAIARAELVLWVLDGTGPLTEDDHALLAEVPANATLAVVNKRDRMANHAPEWLEELADLPWVSLSAQTGEGLAHMEEWVRNWALSDEKTVVEDALLTNLRQQEAARKALDAVAAAGQGVENGVGDELIAVDLQAALAALGDIVGETTSDDLLNRIFADFCIGK